MVAVKSDADADDGKLAEDLFRFGRDRLAGFKVPRQVAFIEVLPRNHFGKVLKRNLRDQTFGHVFDRPRAGGN